MRNDEDLIADICDAIEDLLAFTSGYRRSQFLDDKKTRAAALRQIEVIGEAARKLSPEYKARLPHIPWSNIVGMRNRVVHDYKDVDYDLVWLVVQQSAPTLLEQLRNR